FVSPGGRASVAMLLMCLLEWVALFAQMAGELQCYWGASSIVARFARRAGERCQGPSVPGRKPLCRFFPSGGRTSDRAVRTSCRADKTARHLRPNLTRTRATAARKRICLFYQPQGFEMIVGGRFERPPAPQAFNE